MQLIGGQRREAGDAADGQGEEGGAAAKCVHEGSLNEAQVMGRGLREPSDSNFYDPVRPVTTSIQMPARSGECFCGEGIYPRSAAQQSQIRLMRYVWLNEVA
ncbi:hypothetical protein BR1R3_16810 [Pseudomonas atacamensis]|nr:hypothetical protein BR1R3_16810 [Pseudomonas atacamensis]